MSKGEAISYVCQELEVVAVSQLCNGVSKIYLEKMRKKKKQNKTFVLLQNIGTHTKLKIRIKAAVSQTAAFSHEGIL